MTRAVLLALLMAFCAPVSARAALTLCNRTSYILGAATAATGGPGANVAGWTRIVPGDCQVARKEALTSGTYLVHARSSLAHSGPSRVWGGRYSVCVKDGNFTLKPSAMQPACTAEGTFALPFAPIGNHGKSSWTMNFDEQPAMTLTQAQLAGVKRLLTDNGYKVGAIDGKPNKATGAALAEFRKKMHFAPLAGNAELFDALEREAARKTAPAGYAVCNDSKETLLVALGQGDGGKAVSRGWWTVPAEGCARAIAMPLTGDTVYLLVQRANGTAVVAGPRTFCTVAAAFEIRGAGNCAARGYAEAGFARTDTRGRSGVIVHVGAAGLENR
ncbi:MAG TPA: DUF1036 domain-containing protein [Rhizomicrobium sp.]|nr:DUF1036 domain-containing protein [Rhizomicrobium sp.]